MPYETKTEFGRRYARRMARYRKRLERFRRFDEQAAEFWRNNCDILRMVYAMDAGDQDMVAWILKNPLNARGIEILRKYHPSASDQKIAVWFAACVVKSGCERAIKLKAQCEQKCEYARAALD